MGTIHDLAGLRRRRLGAELSMVLNRVGCATVVACPEDVEWSKAFMCQWAEQVGHWMDTGCHVYEPDGTFTVWGIRQDAPAS